jgi:glycosyltransferase involved in cell wall biosynthesis
MVFGCAAQFVEIKEHLTVLTAFERLLETYGDIYLLFCGTNRGNNYYKSFLKRYENSPAKEHVRILGTLSHMPTFYSAIDCFVLVSRFEAFGYVYIEAMSCKRPVIACKVLGPAEIVVQGETGLFAEMSDPNHLAERMRTYLKNPELLELHGNAARQRVIDKFSSSIMARRTQDLYLETYKMAHSERKDKASVGRES